MTVPKGTFWGVDSVSPITGLLETIIKKAGRAPDFWGRYIGRFVITQKEIDFLRRFSPQTRLQLIFNPFLLGFFQDTPPNPAAERARGKAIALRAVAAASSLKVPAGVSIYVNVEPDSERVRIGKVSADWILGWWEGMRDSKHGVGGIYANVSQRGKNVAFLGDAYTEAVKREKENGKPPIWGLLDHKGPLFPKSINFGFEPAPVAGTPDAVVIWQYFATTKGSFDMDLATKAAFDKMWKLDPLPGAPKEEEVFEHRNFVIDESH